MPEDNSLPSRVNRAFVDAALLIQGAYHSAHANVVFMHMTDTALMILIQQPSNPEFLWEHFKELDIIPSGNGDYSVLFPLT